MVICSTCYCASWPSLLLFLSPIFKGPWQASYPQPASCSSVEPHSWEVNHLELCSLTLPRLCAHRAEKALLKKQVWVSNLSYNATQEQISQALTSRYGPVRSVHIRRPYSRRRGERPQHSGQALVEFEEAGNATKCLQDGRQVCLYNSRERSHQQHLLWDLGPAVGHLKPCRMHCLLHPEQHGYAR